MVPIPLTAARGRLFPAVCNGRDPLTMPENGNTPVTDPRIAFSSRTLHNTPRVTYGRKPNKLLPLSANQFRRPDIFDSPFNNGYTEFTKDDLPAAHDEESDDSLLSGADTPLPRHRVDKNVEHSSRSTRRDGPTNRGSRPETTTESMIEGVRVKESNSQLISNQNAEKSKHDSAKRPSRRAKKYKQGPSRSKRRLPVNELLMVDSQAGYDMQAEQADSPPGVLEQDPIASSSQLPRRLSPSGSPLEKLRPKTEQKTPLSDIRKRLRTPVHRHRSFKALRRNRGRESTICGTAVIEVGDGFDSFEREIPAQMRSKRSERRMVQTRQMISALSFQHGPLPSVVFSDSSSAVKDEHTTSTGGHLYATESSNILPRPSSLNTSSALRRVSFKTQAREDLINEQLSSVSAPRRQYSVSDDEEGEEEEDNVAENHHPEQDEEDEQDEDMPDVIDLQDEDDHDQEQSDGELLDDDIAADVVVPPPFHGYTYSAAGLAAHEENDDGVTLDFRKHTTPSLRHNSFGFRQRLVEANEPISDEPEPVLQQLHVPPEVPVPTTAPRPRSILRNSTPHVPAASERPESTAANTRRNSVVIAEESSYFSNAVDSLQQSSPSKRVIRRKTNGAAYAVVQVPDSECMIPETSPGPRARPLDYSNPNQLNILRQQADHVWISRVPTVTKDLRALTRTVSREHGTLSQSVRRRPSMPFQSPTKVQ